MNRDRSVAIHIRNLYLAFGKTEVLKGIDLEIKPGELFSFLGPSGSGKSTLLRAIAGFGPEPKGQILLDDQEMRLSVRYWEGAVEVIDEVSGEALGRGYLEMAGY